MTKKKPTVEALRVLHGEAPDDYLGEALKEVEKEISQGPLLERVREALKLHRELTFELEELDRRRNTVQSQLTELNTQTMIKLFSEAHMLDFTLEAEGNYPAIKAKRVPFYSAKIPDDKQEEAFDWFHESGHGDLVKTTISLAFGMKERKLAEKVEAALEKLKVDYNSKLSVHASTLLAFVKAEIEAGRPLPKDLLGVYVGETVKVSPVKAK